MTQLGVNNLKEYWMKRLNCSKEMLGWRLGREEHQTKLAIDRLDKAGFRDEKTELQTHLNLSLVCKSTTLNIVPEMPTKDYRSVSKKIYEGGVEVPGLMQACCTLKDVSITRKDLGDSWVEKDNVLLVFPWVSHGPLADICGRSPRAYRFEPGAPLSSCNPLLQSDAVLCVRKGGGSGSR